MSYNKTIWINGQSKLNEENLNKIENGIFNAHAKLDNLDIHIDQKIKEEVSTYVDEELIKEIVEEEITEAINLIDSISVNGVVQEIDENKNVNIIVPTKVGDLNNDKGFLNKGNLEELDLSKKIDDDYEITTKFKLKYNELSYTYSDTYDNYSTFNINNRGIILSDESSSSGNSVSGNLKIKDFKIELDSWYEDDDYYVNNKLTFNDNGISLKCTYAGIPNELTINENGLLFNGAPVGGEGSVNSNFSCKNLTVAGKVKNQLVPSENNSFNLGSDVKGWKNLYLSNSIKFQKSIDSSNVPTFFEAINYVSSGLHLNPNFENVDVKTYGKELYLAAKESLHLSAKNKFELYMQNKSIIQADSGDISIASINNINIIPNQCEVSNLGECNRIKIGGEEITDYDTPSLNNNVIFSYKKANSLNVPVAFAIAESGNVYINNKFRHEDEEGDWYEKNTNIKIESGMMKAKFELDSVDTSYSKNEFIIDNGGFRINDISIMTSQTESYYYKNKNHLRIGGEYALVSGGETKKCVFSYFAGQSTIPSFAITEDGKVYYQGKEIISSSDFSTKENYEEYKEVD